jgi:hypothetical protein
LTITASYAGVLTGGAGERVRANFPCIRRASVAVLMQLYATIARLELT